MSETPGSRPMAPPGEPVPAEIAAALGEALLHGQRVADTLDLAVQPESVADACRYLAAPEGGRYDYLASLTAVDRADQGELEIVYHAYRVGTRERVIVRLRVGRDAPAVPTVTGVWPAANWKEREVAEMFGVTFAGHPDPRPLLLPEDWTELHPLRKDFVEPNHPWRAPDPLHEPPQRQTRQGAEAE